MFLYKLQSKYFLLDLVILSELFIVEIVKSYKYHHVSMVSTQRIHSIIMDLPSGDRVGEGHSDVVIYSKALI